MIRNPLGSGSATPSQRASGRAVKLWTTTVAMMTKKGQWHDQGGITIAGILELNGKQGGDRSGDYAARGDPGQQVTLRPAQ